MKRHFVISNFNSIKDQPFLELYLLISSFHRVEIPRIHQYLNPYFAILQMWFFSLHLFWGVNIFDVLLLEKVKHQNSREFRVFQSCENLSCVFNVYITLIYNGPFYEANVLVVWWKTLWRVWFEFIFDIIEHFLIISSFGMNNVIRKSLCVVFWKVFGIIFILLINLILGRRVFVIL